MTAIIIIILLLLLPYSFSSPLLLSIFLLSLSALLFCSICWDVKKNSGPLWPTGVAKAQDDLVFWKDERPSGEMPRLPDPPTMSRADLVTNKVFRNDRV